MKTAINEDFSQKPLCNGARRVRQRELVRRICFALTRFSVRLRYESSNMVSASKRLAKNRMNLEKNS